MYIFGLKSSHLSCSVKKCVLKISQISPENTCVESLLASLRPAIVSRRESQVFFPVKFAKFLRILIEEYLRMTDCFTIFFLMVLITTYFFVQDQTEIDEEWVSQSPHRRLYFPQNNHFLY